MLSLTEYYLFKLKEIFLIKCFKISIFQMKKNQHFSLFYLLLLVCLSLLWLPHFSLLLNQKPGKHLLVCFFFLFSIFLSLKEDLFHTVY